MQITLDQWNHPDALLKNWREQRAVAQGRAAQRSEPAAGLPVTAGHPSAAATASDVRRADTCAVITKF